MLASAHIVEPGLHMDALAPHQQLAQLPHARRIGALSRVLCLQGYSGELDVEAELAGMEERRRPMSAGDRIRGGIAKGGKKRQAKDSKFGKQCALRSCQCSTPCRRQKASSSLL